MDLSGYLFGWEPFAGYDGWPGQYAPERLIGMSGRADSGHRVALPRPPEVRDTSVRTADHILLPSIHKNFAFYPTFLPRFAKSKADLVRTPVTCAPLMEGELFGTPRR
ncbi:MAG: hypothetical protein AAGA25_04145, partial [Planctomycetota bacterium]